MNYQDTQAKSGHSNGKARVAFVLNAKLETFDCWGNFCDPGSEEGQRFECFYCCGAFCDAGSEKSQRFECFEDFESHWVFAYYESLQSRNHYVCSDCDSRKVATRFSSRKLFLSLRDRDRARDNSQLENLPETRS